MTESRNILGVLNSLVSDYKHKEAVKPCQPPVYLHRCTVSVSVTEETAAMNKIKRWLNKPKKEVENQIQPWTTEKGLRACHDVTIVTETLSSTLQRLGALSLDHRSLLQVEQATGDWTQMELTGTRSCDIISLRSAVGELPVRSSLKTRDNCSLPSSPYPGGRRRLPCSLPCSPLLGGRHWRSSPIPPSPPPGLSRLLVEAALQRSKNIRPSPPCSPQVRQVRQEGQEEQVRSSLEETEEDGEEEEQSDEDKVSTVKTFGIRLDTVIFRPLTSPSVCGREEEEQQEQQGDVFRYCLLTPCVCFRCPSAPPYETQVFSAGDVQTVSSFSSEDQKHNRSLTQLSHKTDTMRTNEQRTEGGSEQSLHRDRAPWLGESPRLYPSLTLWRTDSQTELNRKQEEEVNSFDSLLGPDTIQSCFHGNNTDVHLQPLCEVISGVSGELQTLCPADLSFTLKMFESTTCSKRTAAPDDSCSFCSAKLNIQNKKHLCRNCDQVFCGRCLCHFVSLLRIHQFS